MRIGQVDIRADAVMASLATWRWPCVAPLVEYMVTDRVTWAYHGRGRLRPESVKVIEKCGECGV